MRRELIAVGNPKNSEVKVAWMTTAEKNKLRRRIENEHLSLYVTDPYGFEDTNLTMTAAEVISALIPRRKTMHN